jgi:type IV pilus assembly protein PilA
MGAFTKQSNPYRSGEAKYLATQQGFTLIELIIVVVIIGFLASVAMSSYQTYTVRAQASEGLSLAGTVTIKIVDSYIANGESPTDRDEAGLSTSATDTYGKYVEEVEIDDGRIGVTFGNDANALIANTTLYITPYETPEGSVVWRCGAEDPPSAGGSALNPMGSAGGGNTAAFMASTIDGRFLPGTCR